MRSTRVAALLALALAGAAPAQPPQPQAAAATPPPASADFSADRFKAHVAFLADDALEGRDTGSRGYDVAAAYVASQFTALGLTPGGEKGSWYARVPFRSATLSGTPTVSIAGPDGTRSWDNGTDVIVRPSLQEPEQDVTAPVVFAGYGLDAPGQGLDDYKGLDVRGKIVALFSGVPSGLDSEIAAHLGDQKEAMAARRGAVGVLTIPTIRSAKVRPWRTTSAGLARPSLAWIGPDGKANEEAPGLRVGATLNDPAAAALFAGARRSYAAVRAEADRDGARPRGFALKTTLRLQRRSDWTTISSPEVIGILPGSDPALKDEYVILMGHLDHLGMRKNAKPGEDAVYNGALDNGAGIATMIEAARAFTESGERPRRSILFIANTGEEKGLLGASYFAANPTVPIGSIAGAVDLDMPLLLYPFTDVIAFGAEHSTVAEAVRRAAAKMGVALSPDPMPEQNIFVRSDHYEFVRQGVPAILLATGYANGGEAKWGWFFEHAYHKVGDDLTQPIDWASGARYAELNYLIARELADADQRPRWYRGDYFGDLFAPGRPRAPRPAR
ncbi:MAG: M20/M25/M40 family metallo-hydrolase [Alphaproteobacteria bacterium]|nr:M20/M25/M40 family metallo-hydrolase [Alphaproteobacteria bacterium]MBV9370956.1 M20/M25/M40 family metallo-hydrolase [Alphaproteobacteria bacterium]MBV9899499.1 M20/M25/M40 family metallo-hydrolase [Alphaproteobacteria bacterium]